MLPVMETPPLTRGRLENVVDQGYVNGNTPAYAGKTTCRKASGRMMRKHPRLRGEDVFSVPFHPDAPETPPLTRGRLVGRFLN